MQQLCEAGEAEFLEIMDLVGMASKPMHVRRLQKALQEWVQNPGRVFKNNHKLNIPKILRLNIMRINFIIGQENESDHIYF